MASLSKFLRARIDEDEKVARAAHMAAWDFAVSEPEESVSGQAGRFDAAQRAYLLKLGPERMLVECETKRRILEVAKASSSTVTRALLELMAVPYASHDDYKKDWRP
ncbi:MAG: DUF6221 family protein [Actinomycetota bacterium]|nr:DUF6221 family protein [Actinomycetota bacterium]